MGGLGPCVFHFYDAHKYSKSLEKGRGRYSILIAHQLTFTVKITLKSKDFEAGFGSDLGSGKMSEARKSRKNVGMTSSFFFRPTIS